VAVTGGRPAAFLDKDGTLVDDVPYNVDPDLVRLTRGAGSAVRALGEAGYLVVVVSNQSGVADGRFDLHALRAVQRHIERMLAAHGARIDAWFSCPHAAWSGCACRKPAAGMLLRAADELGIDLARSWFVGDILDDVEAGHRAGCRTVLLDAGNETEWRRSPIRTPDHRARDLRKAASLILAAGRAVARAEPTLEAAR
jgi:D-glycero-D-manno-heptose 1,7-bisphosphate phosphatase